MIPKHLKFGRKYNSMNYMQFPVHFRIPKVCTHILTRFLIYSIIELTIAIMVGCAPAAYAFWTSYAVESALFSRITAIVSLLSLPRSSRSKRSVNQSNTDANGDHAKSEDIDSINLIHPYGVIDDHASAKNGGRSTIAVADPTSNHPSVYR